MCGPGKHNCQPFCGPEGRFYCSDSVCSPAVLLSMRASEDLGCAEKVVCCCRIKACLPSPPAVIVQELCESRGGRPGLSVLTSLLVSVDVKIY